MSFNQARAERSESHYRRPGRPGNPVYQRVSSGGVGKGGGGTGLPPASANSQSSTNRSFKKSNGQWAQSRVTVTSANSESSAVHNGARAQPSLQGASNALFTDASAKSTDMHNQRSHQTASSAPTSASASGTSESTAPTTPVRADTSKGVSLQFGSFSPNIVSGMQIPARTSSAPPNLHEQKCDQARHDSFRSDPLLPTSISNRQQPREEVEQSKSTVPHPPSSDKRGVRAQASAYSGATSAKNSSTPLSAASMAIPFHQSRVVQVGKVTDTEAAKQRQLKAILNKLTPQNFDRLFEQVKEVNIDNAVTLTGVISQIFDKALMEPTFCEMYANFCHDLAGELPDFVEDNEKITFKRLLLNKCQEEFERGEREQAEADKVEGDGKVKQSAVEREEKRVQARRRMLGNIRLIGELYKKRMLTERIMHECIKKLLGQYPDPEEEDIEALCKLMSTIGEMIDHPKAKEHMDAYFERMTNLSTNMKLSSRVRFMLKDSIDLRKNKWQQRRKVDGPKKIEEVHRDAAQERQQVNRLTRSSSISSSARRGQPSDFGPRPSTMFSPPNTPQGTFRGVPPQLRGFGTQGIRFEDRHPYENRTLSVPLSHRPVDDNAITLGPQGGLARGMSIRGPAILSSAPLADISTGPGESRRIHAGPNGYSSASEWMPSRQEPMTRYVQERFTRPAAYNNLNPQEHGVRYGDRGLNNADHSFGSSMAGSPAATHVKSSATPIVSSGKVWPEERLRDMSMAAIREFYSAADEKEVALCIRELNSPSFYPSMISIWVNDSFERKDRDRDLLAGLLVNLTKSRDSMLISPVQLMQGIELVLATLEDSITDAPKAAEFLGCVIARTIVENVISMRDIGQLIRQGGEEPGRLLQIGLGYEVLQSAFHTIRSDKGESTLNDICTSSNLQLEDFLPSSGPIN